MTTFKRADLFGGAMTVELPQNFHDVSDIRQVPDNQEVYLDKDGFTSIVFDILERVERPTTDGSNPDLEALKYHLSDILSEDIERSKTWTTATAVLDKLPPNTPTYTLFATHESSPETVARGKAPDFTAILLVLIRLQAQETDIVITVNVPHAPSEYPREEVDPAAGKQGRLLEAAQQYRDRILQTFEIRDWDLFVQE